MKAFNQLAPEGHENLAIVASSVQHAIFAGSSRLMRRQPSASTILSQAGQQVGQQDSSLGAANHLSWNECKAISLEATAYRTKNSLPSLPKHKPVPHSKARRGFQDVIKT